MGRTVFRVTIVSILVGVVSATAWTLQADNPSRLVPRGGGDEVLERPRGMSPCPFPSCAAPCQIDAPPQVLCRQSDGSVQKTSFACCCCGGSAGRFFRPL